MSKFIMVDDKYINMDKVRYIQGITDYQDIFNPATRTIETKHFKTLIFYFKENECIRLRNFSFSDLEMLLNNKKASQ